MCTECVAFTAGIVVGALLSFFAAWLASRGGKRQ